MHANPPLLLPCYLLPTLVHAILPLLLPTLVHAIPPLLLPTLVHAIPPMLLPCYCLQAYLSRHPRQPLQPPRLRPTRGGASRDSGRAGLVKEGD